MPIRENEETPFGQEGGVFISCGRQQVVVGRVAVVVGGTKSEAYLRTKSDGVPYRVSPAAGATAALPGT
jgi:hypothetical protein